MINPPNYMLWAISSIPRLRVLPKKLCQTSLKRASPAAIESPIKIVEEVLLERSIC